MAFRTVVFNYIMQTLACILNSRQIELLVKIHYLTEICFIMNYFHEKLQGKSMHKTAVS